MLLSIKPGTGKKNCLFPRSQNYGRMEKASQQIINTNVQAVPCQGCFQCWTKNAGYCIYADAFQHSGAAVGNSENVVIISKICYGGYSPSIKRFLDRSISDCLPFFTFRKGKTYHTSRYKVRKNLTVYFYGECSEFERETADEYVACHAVGMNADSHKVIFVESLKDIEVIKL